MKAMINIDAQQLTKAAGYMILSTSGWRCVFAKDGNEEGRGTDLSEVHRALVRYAALVFAEYLEQDTAAPVVIVGMDTRPTGRAIADAMIGVLAARCTVRFAGVAAAPEIMAYAKSAGATGFVYISASHNPIGHNGLKFGRGDGGVLPGTEAVVLIDRFRAMLAAAPELPIAEAQLCEAVYKEESVVKRDAVAAYRRFTQEVVTGGRDAVLEAVKDSIQAHSLGIVADLNGSARTVSIDRELFGDLGIRYRAINDAPGAIVHRIVPEGESLEPAQHFLEDCHREDAAFVLGYTPDCDGDRGNLVIWDEGAGQARALEAQEVFALACVAELSHLVWTGELSYDAQGMAQQKVAIVVNDPTSLRIDRIASSFGVSVFRVEVGEANVVGRARSLRKEGWIVRILGEGSAGGTITHPSAVRDPLDTVMALVKLLTVSSRQSGAGREGLFELWCKHSKQGYRSDFSLADIIASLPGFVTTGSYTPDALLQVKTPDHALLKQRYNKIFLDEWEKRSATFESDCGITGWIASAYIGQNEYAGITDFGAAGRGGLRIVFTDKQDQPVASIWMRGSGTEPVFRVMADVQGNNSWMEQELIAWQRDMVIKADSYWRI
jgi:phosphoglucomutase